MSFEIEKGIPINSPEPICGYRYPFSEMEIGDSFFISVDGNKVKAQRVVVSAAYMYSVRKDSTFKIKTRSSLKGIRVWRVS